MYFIHKENKHQPHISWENHVVTLKILSLKKLTCTSIRVLTCEGIWMSRFDFFPSISTITKSLLVYYENILYGLALFTNYLLVYILPVVAWSWKHCYLYNWKCVESQSVSFKLFTLLVVGTNKICRIGLDWYLKCPVIFYSWFNFLLHSIFTRAQPHQSINECSFLLLPISLTNLITQITLCEFFSSALVHLLSLLFDSYFSFRALLHPIPSNQT